MVVAIIGAASRVIERDVIGAADIELAGSATRIAAFAGQMDQS